MAAAKPVLEALVLADHVYSDQRNGKRVIAGTFNTIWAKSFPARHNVVTFAYIALTEVHKVVSLKLVHRDLSNDEAIMESQNITVQAETPLHTVEVVTEIPPFNLPHEGAYAFEIYADGELLGSKRILAKKAEESK